MPGARSDMCQGLKKKKTMCACVFYSNLNAAQKIINSHVVFQRAHKYIYSAPLNENEWYWAKWANVHWKFQNMDELQLSTFDVARTHCKFDVDLRFDQAGCKIGCVSRRQDHANTQCLRRCPFKHRCGITHSFVYMSFPFVRRNKLFCSRFWNQIEFININID